VGQSIEDPGEMITREEAHAVLLRVGVRADRVEEALAGLEFPASKTDINRHLMCWGLDRDSLINRLGGSP
jgi:hypothetical protein